jgi:putative salt-induced outer membrane protein YdiY
MLSLLLALAGGPAVPPSTLPESLAAALEQDPAPAPAEEEKPPAWTGSVTIGGKYTSGNSDTRSGTASADATLRRPDDRITLGFLWLYDENKNNVEKEWDLTDRKTQGSAQYDYFFTKKTYAYAKAMFENDFQSDLELRQTYSAGLGRQFVENEELKLSAEAGLSWIDENFEESEDSEYLAARGAYKVDWVISKVWAFGQAVEVFPSLEKPKDVLVKGDTRVKATFTENFFGQVQWLYDWDSTPADGKERADNQFLLSVGWKF